MLSTAFPRYLLRTKRTKRTNPRHSKDDTLTEFVRRVLTKRTNSEACGAQASRILTSSRPAASVEDHPPRVPRRARAPLVRARSARHPGSLPRLLRTPRGVPRPG